MHVSLTPELERVVGDKVAAGLYRNRSEVVREALRLLAARDDQRRMPPAAEALEGEPGELDRLLASLVAAGPMLNG